MRKLTKLLTLLLASILTLTSLTACGGKRNDKIDTSKIQINVYVVSDGYGYEYMDTLVDRYNERNPDSEYQFVYYYGQDGILKLPSQLQAGICEKHIFIGGDNSGYFTQMIRDGHIKDISDVYDMSVDGEGEGTVREKTKNFDVLKDSYSDLQGNGLYALPRSASVGNALVFNYAHFLKRGYLNYAKASEKSAVEAQGGSVEVVSGESINPSKYALVTEDVLKATADFGNYKAGDVVLTAGRDCAYGTYDDGQVQYVSEFYELLRKIAVKDYAFIYSTQYSGSYAPYILYHSLYQNMGYENLKTFTSFDGDIVDKNGTSQLSVTMENANQMWDTAVIRNAYEKAAEYFDKTMLGHLEGKNNVNKYLSNKTYENGPTTSLSHTDAQRAFALSHYEDSLKDIAFLVEGTWWENESKNVLAQLGGYGSQEHRIYLNPILDGQVGDEDETVFSGSSGSSFMIYLNNYPEAVKGNAEKEQTFDQKVKEFMGYLCSDESLNTYTATHGIGAYYDYELTADTVSKLTPFQKNVFDMLDDTEHIKIMDKAILGGTKNLIRSFMDLTDRYSLKGEITYENPYAAMYGIRPAMTYDEYYSCVRAKINKEYAAQLSNVQDYLNGNK